LPRSTLLLRETRCRLATSSRRRVISSMPSITIGSSWRRRLPPMASSQATATTARLKTSISQTSTMAAIGICRFRMRKSSPSSLVPARDLPLLHGNSTRQFLRRPTVRSQLFQRLLLRERAAVRPPKAVGGDAGDISPTEPTTRLPRRAKAAGAGGALTAPPATAACRRQMRALFDIEQGGPKNPSFSFSRPWRFLRLRRRRFHAIPPHAAGGARHFSRMVTSSSAAVGCRAMTASKSDFVAFMRSGMASNWTISAASAPRI
jgi:hypothetical protein